MKLVRSVRIPRSSARQIGAVVALGLLCLIHARAADEVNLLTFGDWGCGSTAQVHVAKAMADYAAARKFDAAILLGDNFYTLVNDAESPFWQSWFEKMYDPVALNMPFYALLGNHDCEHSNISARAELAYAVAHPESRWKMPSRYYRIDFPTAKPFVSVLMLDDNLQGREWEKEAKWFAEELARPDRPTWLIVASHAPLFSNSEHGDSKSSHKRIGALLEKHRVDLHLAGHDHNLQHIQSETNSTTFIVSGAGGKTLYPMYRDDRGPFTASVYGFVHINLTPERATVRFVSEQGKTLHLFERTPDGKVDVKETTGIQKAIQRKPKDPDKKKSEG